MGNQASAEGQQAKETPSYWQQIRNGYQELVNAIIRPPRCRYKLSLLGPEVFTFCGANFYRKDFDLMNSRNMTLKCSMWLPVQSERKSTALPCVIYMHGNSSGRVEAVGQLATVLSIGATMVAFDFSGSGLSDGDYVSLGYFEKDDLQCVVEHIRNAGGTSLIGLWGRSMGAATALLHGGRDPSMACMVLDSPFTDLSMLAEELVEKGRKNGLFAPSLAVMIAMRAIRSSVLAQADFDIRDISPISFADSCYIPALFIAAESDAFIGPHHSQQLCDKYSGDKNLILVRGDHNSVRPVFLFDSVSIFLINALRIPEEWLLRGMTSAYVGRSPWRLTPMQYSGFGVETAVIERQAVAPEEVSIRLRSGSGARRQTQEASDEEIAWQLMREDLEALDDARDLQNERHEDLSALVREAHLSEELAIGNEEDVSKAIHDVFGGAKKTGNNSGGDRGGSAST